jgi:PAC2 family protein
VPLARVLQHLHLTAPVIVAAFDGWIDAGGAATAATAHLAAEGSTIVEFDGDVLFDYRSRRPVLHIQDGTLSELRWPELVIRHVGLGGRDVLVFWGAEPDFRWRELAAEVASICRDLRVSEWISLGAIPAAVPHTRPVAIMGTASRAGALPDDVQQGPAGLLQVPSAALSVLEMGVTSAGVPAIGFYAQVPHYVAGPFAGGTIALLQQVERRVGFTLPLGQLPDEAAAQRVQLDTVVAQDEDVRTYVSRLEEALEGTERVPTGDELASEIERFLRQVHRGDGGSNPEPLGPTDPRGGS